MLKLDGGDRSFQVTTFVYQKGGLSIQISYSLFCRLLELCTISLLLFEQVICSYLPVDLSCVYIVI